MSHPAPEGTPPGVVEERDIEIPGTSSFYDSYAPAGPPAGTVAAVHGLAVNGGRDARLVRLARFIAQRGVTCLTPTLGSLADCRWDTEDIEAIGRLVESTTGAIGLVGFSWGGSYSLIAAGRSEWADRVRFVLAVGAYYRLEEVLDWIVERQKAGMEPGYDLNAYIYERLVLAYQNREDLGLDPGIADEIRSLLARYSHGATEKEKNGFHDRHLRDLVLDGTPRDKWGHEILEALSPAGRLSSIRCPVHLVHGSGDTAVPPSDSHRIHEELAAHPSGESHSILVTSLMSHVNVAGIARPWEIWGLYKAFAPIFEPA